MGFEGFGGAPFELPLNTNLGLGSGYLDTSSSLLQPITLDMSPSTIYNLGAATPLMIPTLATTTPITLTNVPTMTFIQQPDGSLVQAPAGYTPPAPAPEPAPAPAPEPAPAPIVAEPPPAPVDVPVELAPAVLDSVTASPDIQVPLDTEAPVYANDIAPVAVSDESQVQDAPMSLGEAIETYAPDVAEAQTDYTDSTEQAAQNYADAASPTADVISAAVADAGSQPGSEWTQQSDSSSGEAVPSSDAEASQAAADVIAAAIGDAGNQPDSEWAQPDYNPGEARAATDTDVAFLNDENLTSVDVNPDDGSASYGIQNDDGSTTTYSVSSEGEVVDAQIDEAPAMDAADQSADVGVIYGNDGYGDAPAMDTADHSADLAVIYGIDGYGDAPAMDTADHSADNAVIYGNDGYGDAPVQAVGDAAPLMDSTGTMAQPAPLQAVESAVPLADSPEPMAPPVPNGDEPTGGLNSHIVAANRGGNSDRNAIFGADGYGDSAYGDPTQEFLHSRDGYGTAPFKHEVSLEAMVDSLLKRGLSFEEAWDIATTGADAARFNGQSAPEALREAAQNYTVMVGVDNHDGKGLQDAASGSFAKATLRDGTEVPVFVTAYHVTDGASPNEIFVRGPGGEEIPVTANDQMSLASGINRGPDYNGRADDVHIVQVDRSTVERALGHSVDVSDLPRLDTSGVAKNGAPVVIAGYPGYANRGLDDVYSPRVNVISTGQINNPNGDSSYDHNIDVKIPLNSSPLVSAGHSGGPVYSVGPYGEPVLTAVVSGTNGFENGAHGTMHELVAPISQFGGFFEPFDAGPVGNPMGDQQ